MDSCNFPRTVDEMLEAGWYDKILRKIKKYHLNDILNTPEEMVQDVFLQIIKTDYLSRYDPEYRPFNVYIYVLVENLCKKRGTREGTKGGTLIVNHASLAQTSEGSTPEANTVYLDLLDVEPVTETADDKLYVDALVESTMESLLQYKAHSSVDVDGVTVERDPLTVFKLILEGKSISEIAEIMQTSKQFIYVLLHKIRGVPAMQELYRNAVEGNLVQSA